MQPDWHVVFEGGAEIVVRRACNRCYGSQVSVAELAERGPFEIVSSEGTVHARAVADGETACGIPTTGPGWWTAPEETPAEVEGHGVQVGDVVDVVSDIDVDVQEMPSGLSPTAGQEAAKRLDDDLAL